MFSRPPPLSPVEFALSYEHFLRVLVRGQHILASFSYDLLILFFSSRDNVRFSSILVSASSFSLSASMWPNSSLKTLSDLYTFDFFFCFLTSGLFLYIHLRLLLWHRRPDSFLSPFFSSATSSRSDPLWDLPSLHHRSGSSLDFFFFYYIIVRLPFGLLLFLLLFSLPFFFFFFTSSGSSFGLLFFLYHVIQAPLLDFFFFFLLHRRRTLFGLLLLLLHHRRAPL
jgi:hypothetical protein